MPTDSATERAERPERNLDNKKRKTSPTPLSGPAEEAKKQKRPPKAGASEENATDSGSDVVTINRAPVLELWSASVAHLLYPSIPWTTCLSIGGAISTITAISKGRAIGKMDRPDPASAEEKRQKRREEQANLEEVEVMNFHLHIKEGHAMVGDKPRKNTEDVLIKKYGPQSYENVKSAFENCLVTWKGREDELDKQAFHMYEELRPNIPPGQKGWGRKGALSLTTIDRVVRSPA